MTFLTHEQLEAGRAKAIEKRRRESRKLERDVMRLRRMGFRPRVIAANLGVTRQAVYKVLKRLDAQNGA